MKVFTASTARALADENGVQPSAVPGLSPSDAGHGGALSVRSGWQGHVRDSRVCFPARLAVIQRGDQLRQPQCMLAASPPRLGSRRDFSRGGKD